MSPPPIHYDDSDNKPIDRYVEIQQQQIAIKKTQRDLDLAEKIAQACQRSRPLSREYFYVLLFSLLFGVISIIGIICYTIVVIIHSF